MRGWVQGSGFRVEGLELGLRVWSLGFVWGMAFSVGGGGFQRLLRGSHRKMVRMSLHLHIRMCTHACVVLIRVQGILKCI